jgi:hypothetical protein
MNCEGKQCRQNYWSLTMGSLAGANGICTAHDDWGGMPTEYCRQENSCFQPKRCLTVVQRHCMWAPTKTRCGSCAAGTKLAPPT